MRRNLCGSSLTQYAIVLAVLVIGIVPCYMVFGNQIKAALTRFHDQLSDNNVVIQENANPFYSDIINGNVGGGQLGGTPQTPVNQCVGDRCVVDFGSVVLNNIPHDFSEIIETSGASGGTEVVLGLVEQVAEQLKDNPDVTKNQLEQIKNLITYGNDIKELEKLFESKYDNLLNYKDKLVQYSDQMSALWQQKSNNQIDQVQFDQLRENLTAQYKPYIDQYKNDVHGTSSIMLGGEQKEITLWQNFVLLNPEAVVTNQGDRINISQPEYHFDLDTYSSYLAKDMNLAVINDPDKESMSPVGKFMQSMIDLNESEMTPELFELTKTLAQEIYDTSQAVRTNIDVFGLNLTSYNPEYAYHANLYNPVYGGDPRYQNTGASVFDIVTSNNMRPSELTRMDLNIMCSSRQGKYDHKTGSCSK